MKRFLALALAMLMVISLVACGGSKTPTSSGTSAGASTPSTGGSSAGTTEPSKPDEPAKPAEPKILNVGSTATANSACVLVDQGSGSIAINQNTVATLYMVLPENGASKLQPALADGEPIDVNGDGLTWNIKINPAAMFENGEKITADTMVYTLKEALDPKLVLKYGSNIYTNYVTILNGQEYYNQASSGVAVNWEDVGIKKVDEMTIQIVLKQPANTTLVMRHFSARQTAPIYQPLWEKCKSADGTTTTYGSSVETWISSGPFKLTNWVIGSIRELERNENFIRADLVKLDGMCQKVVTESSTLIQLFDKGEIDYIELSADAMAVYGDDPRIENYPSRRVDTMIFNENSSNPFITNENFRLALYWGTDREAIAKVAGELPGAGHINYRSAAYSDGTKYRTIADAAGYMPENNGYDPEKAKTYFEKALQEVGKSSAEVTISLESGATQQEVIAQFVQESWPKLFGEDKIKITVEAMPKSSYGAQLKSYKTNPDAYQIGFQKWDLTASDWDPIAYLKGFTNTYSGRYVPAKFEELNNLYNKANEEYLLDPEKRCELAMEMEKYLIDHAIAVPVLYRTNYILIADRVVLGVDEWDSDLGWGWRYCDIAQ